VVKIFILIPWFHPAYKAGGPIQSIANMVNQYTANITYKIFCSNIDLDGTVLNVPINTWVKHNESTEVFYTSIKLSSLVFLKREIKNQGADILFINGIYSWYFNLLPLLFCKVPRKIISVRGMLHPGALSQKKAKKHLYLFLWKLFGLHKKFDFHASTKQEKEFIEIVFGKHINVFIAQNFPRVLKRQDQVKKIPGYLDLISIALISPMKNHLLILKALASCNSNIWYNIYGSVKDPAYWSICLEEIKKLPANIIVKYHGDIPPPVVENVLAQNHTFVLPSKSENFGHAIYEALTAGIPVITSDKTPWNELNASKAGINVSNSNIQELIHTIEFFAAMDENEFEEWRAGAANYAVESLNIDHIKQQYNTMFFA
jgi:glycosyltransferase involved in cell wall biosynthesis